MRDALLLADINWLALGALAGCASLLGSFLLYLAGRRDKDKELIRKTFLSKIDALEVGFSAHDERIGEHGERISDVEGYLRGKDGYEPRGRR